MLQSPLDKPIISWEEFDRIFENAFSPKKPGPVAAVAAAAAPVAPRPATPDPVVLSDTSAGAVDADGDGFSGFLSEDEIPMYTPLLFPSVIRKRSSDSLRSGDTKISNSISSLPRRPRIMSNQVSSRRTISSSGSVPRIKRRDTKPKVQSEQSDDGTTTTASIDVPNILKDSLNVDFHQDHLVVTWRTATVTDKVLKDSIIRERKEKRYTQTIITPEGTKFENIRASLKGRTLTVSFPTSPKVPGVLKKED
ncbi:hypothetical protein M408DRAFT_14311 [Serendipita vermifera MAFF 305830]|uniref:SHSP domain-containing protein n=1 Tax=Serendipita vermifera MAFF 305830 TaxID=933852 RepID=A0A0C3BA43_SERVB|nr:hypothetical protein M408DRAFT_14311 [Serendipita vermifera MAFF 305830]